MIIINTFKVRIKPILITQITSPDNVIVDVPLTFDVSSYFLDPYGDGEWSLQDAPEWAVAMDIDQNGVITGTPDEIATSNVTVRLTNDIGYAEASFDVAVGAAEGPPVYLDTFTTQNTIEDTVFSYDVKPHFDGDLTLAEFTATGLPSGITLGLTTGIISGIATVSGTFNPIVTATNTAGSDNGTFELNVGWAPSWVGNAGTKFLSREGAVGINTAYFETCMLVRNLDGLPAAINRISRVTSRTDVKFLVDKKLQVILYDTNGGVLVNWTSTNALGAGEWLIHMAADLDGTNTFEVYVLDLTDVSPSWAALAGSFTTSPIGGIIHHSRSGVNLDNTILGNTDGSQVTDLEIGYYWFNSATPLGRTSFFNNVLKNPTTVGSPIELFMGAATDWNAGTNFGTGPDFTPSGSGAFINSGEDPPPPLPDDLNPRPLIGWGANTTGGRGGKFVRVTSLSNSAGTSGSLNWALAQHPGQPLYIALCVEGGCNLTSTLTITRSNVTIDGRYAPGVGYWLYGNRVEHHGSNIFQDNYEHFGNDNTHTASSDCMSAGIYSSSGTGLLNQNLYFRNMGWYHSLDENFGHTARANDQSSGNTCRNVTVENCINGTPKGNNVEPPHNFCVILSAGAENLTYFGTLLMNGASRYPLCQGFTKKVEWYCNAIYNFTCGKLSANWVNNGNCIIIRPNAEIAVRNCHFRLGQLFQDDVNIIDFAATGSYPGVYINGNLIDSKVGMTNSRPLVDTGGTPASSMPWSGSGISLINASAVEAHVSANTGTFGYNNVRRAYSQQHITDYENGTGPNWSTSLGQHGPMPTTTGATFPAHTNGVPNAYLAEYPNDTNPEAIINDGSNWNGYMVAERVGEWLRFRYTP